MNIIVAGKNKRLIIQVLIGVRSYSDAKCLVLGGAGTGAVRWSSLCHGYTRTSFAEEDDDTFVATINEIHRQTPDSILIPADCEAQRTLNRTRQRLKINVIPFADTKTLDILDDKWKFYQFCKEHGFRTPKTIFVGHKNELDFEETQRKIGLPFVIKPLSECGSFGVHIVRTRDYYESMIGSNQRYNFNPIIAQEYIDGADLGLDLLSIDGEVSVFAIQERHSAGVSFLPDTYLENIVHRLCQECNYSGVMNIDIRRERTTGNAYLIEANPRFWVTHCAAVWNGMNFVAAVIEQKRVAPNPRKLVAGGFHDRRHPLLRPSWWPLLLDPGARGRMLRIMMLDRYHLLSFAISLPIRTWRFLYRLFIPESNSRPSV